MFTRPVHGILGVIIHCTCFKSGEGQNQGCKLAHECMQSVVKINMVSKNGVIITPLLKDLNILLNNVNNSDTGKF